MKTYNEIYLNARRALIQGGIDDAGFEAKILLCSASGKTKEELVRDLQLYATNNLETEVKALVQRRLSGEPVAYVTESWEFYGIPMYINKSTLIPRIDTEVLVDAAKELLDGYKMDARILDLCCGSGCISFALAKVFPAARFLDIDNSPGALSVARKNIANLDLSSRIVCMQSDVLRSPPMGIGSFDMIVSNPPYIPTSEIDQLSYSVKDFEPFDALDGGSDGLKFYRAIVKFWKSQLRENGFMIFEVGEDQAAAVSDMMLSAGFSATDTRKDTVGTERVVIGLL